MPPLRTVSRAGRHPETVEQTALRFLGRRDRTEAQLRAFLARKGASPPEVRSLLRRFAARGYVDDVAYARRWARARLGRLPMGRARLEEELLSQGIARSTAERALDELFGAQSEFALARECLRRRSTRRAPKSHVHAAMLLRRYGFAEETIETVLNAPEG